MAPALQHDSTTGSEVNPDIRAIQLLFDNERRFPNKCLGFFSSEMFVVVRPLRTKKMGRARIFHEVISSGAHKNCFLYHAKGEGEPSAFA